MFNLPNHKLALFQLNMQIGHNFCGVEGVECWGVKTALFDTIIIRIDMNDKIFQQLLHTCIWKRSEE